MVHLRTGFTLALIMSGERRASLMNI